MWIIVGGGTAGLALSTRLSQGLPKSRVLVIEAGPAALNELNINIPGKKSSTFGSRYDWNFTTIPQEPLNSRVIPQIRGKVLGGSLALNLMTYDRASAHEYNGWEEIGNSGWDWVKFSAMMKRSLDFTSANTEWYGDADISTKGPSQIRSGLIVSYQTRSIDPEHYNRSYSANAYLPLAGANHVVMADTRVVNINFNNTEQRYTASGVTLADGTIIFARKEVNISAGSYQSPGLLEASGVGSKSVLEGAGILQLIDLPGVGENLQDHIRIQSSYQLKDNYLSFDILRHNATYAEEQLRLWIDGNHSIDEYTGVKGYSAAGTSLYGKGFFSLLAVVMHPLSRGSVHTNVTDPLGTPIINPNYLSNEHDIQAIIAAIKKCRQIALTPILSEVWVSEYEPGLETVNTDAEWREFALNTTLSIYHPAGTCSMLPRKEGGVVDRKLKVYGTTNLRIVDASIIPILISAHMQTAVYGIAEMAAEIIIQEAKKPSQE
ncbi:GMC oxidoreductase [Diplocarpon rosae]|nr:GMC oxidoreductase [Diplocarpon rosae]